MGRIFKSFSTTSDKASKNGNLYDMDVVIADITNLIKTKKGEFPMDVTKGCIAHEYLYNPTLTPAEESIVISDMREQLLTDPRIRQVDVYLESFEHGYYVMVNAVIAPTDEEINLKINLED